MSPYEQNALNEMKQWKIKMNRRSSLLKRVSKKAQTKVNSMIPDKVHHFITESIKKLQWDIRKDDLKTVDWQKFQQEYRDHIDFVKMLQLLPGIGAIVGAYANNNLINQLGETAMNCYRLRLLISRR